MLSSFKVGDTVIDITFEDRTRGLITEVTHNSMIIRYGQMHIIYTLPDIKNLIKKP